MSENIPAISVSRVPQGLVRPVAQPQELIQLHKDVSQIIRESLEDGVDYGKVPGTDKATLLKPGAERLALAFGARADYRLIDSECDHDRTVRYTKRKKVWRDRQPFWEEVEGTSIGLYRFVYECSLVREDGRVLGSGQGVCSTMETKYVDRPRDCENTALKMAQKRAFVAAVLNSFGLSNRFTQDVEDLTDEERSPSPQAHGYSGGERARQDTKQRRAEKSSGSGHVVVDVQPTAPEERKPSVYTGDPEQSRVVDDILRKNAVEERLWQRIKDQLKGKTSTELRSVIESVKETAAAAVDSAF